VDDINLSDLSFWARPPEERDAAFAILRKERPLAFFEEPDEYGVFDVWRGGDVQRGPGYYAVTKWEDILQVSRQAHLYISGRGATSISDQPSLGSMVNMDDPKHARLRGIVSRAFTPRMLKRLENDVQRAATRIVDSVIERGECDFVRDVAARLPLKIICDMMGIPESDYEFIYDRSNVLLAGGDPDYVPHEVSEVAAAVFAARQDLATIVQDLGRYREKNPRRDLTSALVSAEIDGERLTEEELGSFFVLLVTAGSETTRNTISHGLRLLTDHPDQRAVWAADFEGVAPTAVEEILRWASPVTWMRRSASRDTILHGQEIEEGTKLLLFYNSANRDEDVFDDPFRFDVVRDPNPHMSFGGSGPHFCLGAHLARRETRVMFREIFHRLPDIQAVGEPDRLHSSFINGIKHLSCSFTPGGLAA
jgi:cytochrome P450